MTIASAHLRAEEGVTPVRGPKAASARMDREGRRYL